jgi:hypothetical protein
VTPEQERALIEATELGFTEVLREEFEKLKTRILAGVPPRDAVEEAISSFNGQYSALLATAFSAVLSQSVSSQAILDLKIGGLNLSQKLYLNGVGVSETVQQVVDRHLRGLGDARTLAFQIFEGYGFQPVEPLVFNPSNDKLPRYLREAILPDPRSRSELARAFATIQVDNLSTPELQVAYRGVLRAIQRVSEGAGQEYLDRKIEIAFYERMRNFAKRISATEVHRAYMNNRAGEILQDDTTEFIKFDLSSSHQISDICDMFAKADPFGLGAGIYPKRYAPIPPLHPWCLCVLSPRPSLTGRKWTYNDQADQQFLRKLEPRIAARVAGSKAKLERVLTGERMIDVHNGPIDPLYRIKTVGELNANTGT